MVTFQIDDLETPIGDEETVALLEQLDRPRSGQAGGEARELAEEIRAAQLSGANMVVDQRLTPALLATLDDVERARAGLEFPGSLALMRQQLRPLAGIGVPWAETDLSES